MIINGGKHSLNFCLILYSFFVVSINNKEPAIFSSSALQDV